MKLQKLITLVVCFGLSGFATLPVQAASKKKAPAKVSNKKGEPLTPAKLVEDMKSSVVYIVSKSEGVNTKAKQARPYWLGLNSIIDGIDLLEDGMKKKDVGIVKGLEEIGRGLTQTSASWAMIRGAYPKSTAGRGISSLHTVYETYLEHFGPAVARYKKKAPLSDKEKASLARSNQQLDALFANLNKVYAKAKPKSYQQRMLHDLVDLINSLDRVRGKGKGKLGYASFMYQWNRLQQTLEAYSDIIFTLYPDFYEQSWQILEDDIGQMNVCFGSQEEIYASFYEETNWDISQEVIEEYDDYYEETSVVEEIEENFEEKEIEEEFAEVTELEDELNEENIDKLEDNEALEEEIEEEISEDDVDAEHSLAEDVGESYGDDDGDGIEDEEDTDDDNDGVSDCQDTDDDGDGVCDTNDGDSEEEEAEEMSEDDDNGIAECVEGDYDCGSGCSDGGCSGCGGCCQE